MRLIQAQIADEQATQRLQADVAALLRQAEQSRKRLPEEPDPSLLVHDVVALAQQAGVQLTSISRETPQTFRRFTRLAVILQGTASYHQLGAFLDALERSERFLRVERFEISRPTELGPASVHLSISTLYVPPVLPASAGGGA
ncbi:MAG: type 4a pilus biogenesis protein PilO [Candidatus Omnitrophica bacterium]|nr:type 4a pilus biogenesis protein PilO [Candidatus Omnitrophota bacterium]